MKLNKRTFMLTMGSVFGIVFVIVALFYLMTPAVIRYPKAEHAHLRLQIIVNGNPVNFGNAKFQTEYKKDFCSGKLTEAPIHLHDNKNQMVHLHWKGITGGLILKNYGWNLIGGNSSVLGYRFDTLPFIKSVPIHGADLPALPSGASIWVYRGDAKSYTERPLGDFLYQDMEQFLGHKSPINPDWADILDNIIFPKVYAHDDGESLEDINNLLGNIVVFAQKDKPSEVQIKQRFDHLEPLSKSTCGG